jgi:hypothetical protein
VTHDEINRTVAKLRGWKPCNLGYDHPFWQSPNAQILAVPKYTTDPAAWGALLVALAAELPNGYPSLQWFGTFWGSNINVGDDHVTGYSDHHAGEALALAYIASQEAAK